MAKERKNWEEDTVILEEEGKTPPAAAPGPLVEKPSEEGSTLRGSVGARQDEDTNTKETTKPDDQESASRPSEATV